MYSSSVNITEITYECVYIYTLIRADTLITSDFDIFGSSLLNRHITQTIIINKEMVQLISRIVKTKRSITYVNKCFQQKRILNCYGPLVGVVEASKATLDAVIENV